MTIANQINNAQITSCNIQILTSSSGTYTPTSGTKFIIVEMCGGGGGSGGCSASSSFVVSGSGGGGSYLKFKMTAAQIGASLAYTVGTGGAGGAAGANHGVDGVATTFGNWTAGRGTRGFSSTTIGQGGGEGTANTTGTGQLILSMIPPQVNSSFISTNTANFYLHGSAPGGSNPLSTRGNAFSYAVSTASPNAVSCPSPSSGYGVGGANYACWSAAGSLTQAGIAGTAGVIIVTEFI